MSFSIDGIEINDNGGSRSGRDRRESKSMGRNPDRRTEKERRRGLDRRKGQKYRGELAVERRDTFKIWDGE